MPPNPNPTRRLLFLLLLAGVPAATLVGCVSDPNTIPEQSLYDDASNYQRIFDTPVPAGVTVVHSIVVVYEWRLNANTTDDFEFELIVPPTWLADVPKRFHLGRTGDWFAKMAARRKESASPWYMPKPIEDYVLYRDSTSDGYVHMLIDKAPEPDGRVHVFISKH